MLIYDAIKAPSHRLILQEIFPKYALVMALWRGDVLA